METVKRSLKLNIVLALIIFVEFEHCSFYRTNFLVAANPNSLLLSTWCNIMLKNCMKLMNNACLELIIYAMDFQDKKTLHDT